MLIILSIYTKDMRFKLIKNVDINMTLSPWHFSIKKFESRL
jgi:hypothetical protein